MEFKDFGLHADIERALTAKRYSQPTPIQQQAIPVLLEGRDLCGIAQTGTGKTAAFSLPSLDYLLNNPKRPAPRGCRMLVLSPTRELAAQIAQSRSEEHTSELQSLMRISYAVFCLKKKKINETKLI